MAMEVDAHRRHRSRSARAGAPRCSTLASRRVSLLAMADIPTKSLVALRDRREQVIAALTEHFAADLFDVDEFDRRVDRAHLARSIADLDAIMADLPALPTTTPSQALAVKDDPTRPSEKAMWLILGGVDRKGPWTVPRKMNIRCFWGGGSLDFREANFGPGVTEIHVVALMGGLEIIVPPWLAVDVDASAILGGVDARHRAPVQPDPGRPVLRVSGLVIMGGVDIETRLPGETSRDARRREKREKKALKANPPRGLPAGDDK
jgi:hypothetical protein